MTCICVNRKTVMILLSMIDPEILLKEDGEDSREEYIEAK